MIINKPGYKDTSRNSQYFLDLVAEDDLVAALHHTQDVTLQLIASIPNEKLNYRYAANKWTVKEVLGHIIDSERIYAYRALRSSRLDSIELPGFEENDYAPNSNAVNRSIEQFTEEYVFVRQSTVCLFTGMTPEMLDFKGSANDTPYTARGLGFLVAGHNIHHCNILRERYL